jgi:membrane protease subunit HflK
LEAQGEVARFEELLPQYTAAPEVTRQRIYLETLEDVYSSSTKIVVDTGEGGNNMMYLPLDKLLQQQASGQSTTRSRSTIEGLRNNSGAVDQSSNSRPSTRSNLRPGRN